MYEEIRFPHLGIVLEHVGKSIDVFGFSIAYYGIIIAAGMMAAMLICTSLAKKAGLEVDNMHTPVHEQDCLSSDNLNGESVYQTYWKCVED